MAVETVASLLTDLNNQIQDGIAELGAMDVSTMGEPAAKALDCFSRASDILQRLGSALNEDPDGDDDTDPGNGGLNPAVGRAARPPKPAPSRALHYIAPGPGGQTLCGLEWFGKPEVRVCADKAYMTCRECKKRSMP